MLHEFARMAVEGDIPVWIMLFLLMGAVSIIVERVQALYFTYGLKSSDGFMNQVKSLVLADQIEQAISYSAGNQKALLPQVVRSILEKADRDDDGIRNAMEISTMEAVPRLTKRLGHLAMVANVATLVGLLGTITGLIKSFQAVSFADPAQKQTLLAQGISISMNTTALGLFVAIPVMIFYSFLTSRQTKLLEEIEENASKLVDWLVSRHYQSFSETSVFPKGVDHAIEAKTQRAIRKHV